MDHEDTVSRAASTLEEIAGPRAALEFLISRIESEPRWLVLQGNGGWRRHGDDMARLREKVEALGDLEPRLLAIVLAELRRELLTSNSHHRGLYHDDYSYFWRAKRDDFARAAEEALRTQPESRSLLLTVAAYLCDGLDRRDRAIELLLDAHDKRPLDDDGQSLLATYLERSGRHGEAIVLLQGLVERRPNDLSHRTRLMHAYFRTKRQDALLALLAATDKHFHAEKRWGESVAAQLGRSCLENELYEQAAKYLGEAIASREEALAGRVQQDQELAGYYLDQAAAYAGLKNTTKAVDAACSAIVVVGVAGGGVSTSRGTKNPLDVLREVLQASPDLDAYVGELDAQVAKEGHDRPVVRKALGDAYFEQKAYAKAAAQLKTAADLAPNDLAIHRKLVEAHDALEQPQEAARRLLQAIELAPRDVELWRDLAKRIEKLGDTAEAERARTSLVEMLPNETEGHAALAEIRQEQNRWDAAIAHWQEVARLRKLEPTGLLKLAAAQVREEQRDAADATLKQLETTTWPGRFQEEIRKELPKLRAEWSKLN